MNKSLLILCSLYSLNTLADSAGIQSVATWKAVATKHSMGSPKHIEIGTSGIAHLVSTSSSVNNFSSGAQPLYTLPAKQDIPEYKLLSKVISHTLSNEKNGSTVEVGVYYGLKPVSKSHYQQILLSDKKENISFKVANLGNNPESFSGNVDVEFLFVWQDSKAA